MALKINLALEPATHGEHFDRYYAQEGDWFIEIRVPKGERPTSADVYFEFSGEQQQGDK